MGGIVTISYVTSWYTINICIVLLNKIVIKDHFQFPVTLTLFHQAFCFLMATLCVTLKISEAQHLGSRKQLYSVIALSLAVTLSLVTGMWALKFIPVSFDQAIGATTPAFTALLAIVIIGRYERLVTYITLVPVILGIVIASKGEPGFHIVGFLLSMTATAARGAKSVMQQVLLSGDGMNLDSINALRHMCPWAVMVLIPMSFYFEGTQPWLELMSPKESNWFLPALLLNILMAFLVNLFNLLVTKHTSALTIQVLGNAKGVVAAVISVIIFKNPVTAVGAFGYVITIIGTALYTWAKVSESPKPAKTKDEELGVAAVVK
mmetsp:Transcript_39571/g.75786  ORF Transcript_39571/g.75786 Transcript_39571/m.75786 type:complete len:320 (-) Transcript_39571:123-1082(-)|eukprot:CAMPEP_0114253646 /NCGR_PEP_ID=MMETSP0058-20121206/16507_1 /TAXON_ID=36894 /ORGANISM="Pyramimonas parkeae, CCMP726" /LENGTH=319 /DNA_ID=CAMNT_0001367713 /DNA_START=117 /DNA_END=1076 /DNA_ORIENTATION=-